MNVSAYPITALPAQSRDASAGFRYIPPSTPLDSTVLVPNSSPIPSDSPNHQHLPHHQKSTHEMPQSYCTPWSQPSQAALPDPLSAPSGLVNSARPIYASFTRIPAGDGRRLSDTDGYANEGPPRKRINRGDHIYHPPATPKGPTPEQHNVLVPDSPGIQIHGHKRKSNMASPSSDDSMSDIRHSLDAPGPSGRSRIVRGQRPSPSEPNAHKDTTQSKDAFTKFKISNPERDPTLIQSAWDQAGGDIRKATDLLHDPSWRPPPPRSDQSPSEAVPDIYSETGRVSEVDEANKASRAAMKEKAKKSSIYANRTILDTSQLSPVTSTSIGPLVASPVSPSTPMVRPPRRRRINAALMSDSEQSDSGHSRSSSKRPQVNGTEKSAFDYFNAADANALQELTGGSLVFVIIDE